MSLIKTVKAHPVQFHSALQGKKKIKIGKNDNKRNNSKNITKRIQVHPQRAHLSFIQHHKRKTMQGDKDKHKLANKKISNNKTTKNNSADVSIKKKLT